MSDPVPPADAPPLRARGPWWRDKRRRDRVALVVFAVLGVGGILLAASLRFAAGDQRVLVVTMERDAGQQGRELVKRECGDLPGTSVEPDRGDPDPRVQGRFPVRFRVGGSGIRQQAALYACLQEHDDVVRGVLEED